MVKYKFETFARLRPPLKQNLNMSIINDRVLEISNKNKQKITQSNKDQYEFTFTKIFDQNVDQQTVFSQVAQPITKSCMDGFNATIFAYGQTGSGKTYTISGNESFEERGIIPRVFSYIFDEKETRENQEFNIYVSYLEIYNENAYDLLDRKHAELALENWNKIALYEDDWGNLHLRNLSIHQVQCEQDGIDLLTIGNFVKQVSSTPMNQASSRSHCIFTIAFECRDLSSEVIRTSKLHLVDLAGSERVGKTLVEGQILKEAKYINKSLTFLEQVILALHEREQGNRTHIPYRNSLMTTILRDSLGGNCKTCLIATMHSDANYVDETMSTARFAVRCSMLVTEVSVSSHVDLNLLVQRLERENVQLKQRLANEGQGQFLEYQSQPLSKQQIEACKHQVALFIDSEESPPLSIRTLPEVYYCFQLFREALRIKEEMFYQEVICYAEARTSSTNYEYRSKKERHIVRRIRGIGVTNRTRNKQQEDKSETSEQRSEQCLL